LKGFGRSPKISCKSLAAKTKKAFCLIKTFIQFHCTRLPGTCDLVPSSLPFSVLASPQIAVDRVPGLSQSALHIRVPSPSIGRRTEYLAQLRLFEVLRIKQQRLYSSMRSFFALY
jgi:hypothetical protein